MVLTLKSILSRDVTARLRLAIEQGQETDNSLVTEALLSQPLFLLGVEPQKISKPLFSCKKIGMGSPVEAAEAMPYGRKGLRADNGVIVLLNDIAEYEGGEIIINTGWGEEKIKEEAGACILYPASARRGIAKITNGVLYIAELWVQSLVADPRQREILWSIAYSAALIEIFGQHRVGDIQTLKKCHRNLLRMWARP